MKIILPKPTTGLYPAPVNLVTCRSAEGKDNIITLAWNGIVASEPPTITISVRPSRFSHPILANTKVFGVNIPTVDMLEKVDYIGTHSGRNIDKFKETGLTAFPASIINVPLIKECPVNLECRIIDTFDQGTHTTFIGEVVAQHISSECMADKETIDYKKANPLLYCSSKGYFSLGEFLGAYGYTTKAGKK